MKHDSASSVGAKSGSQTFLFADLSGFTALTEAHGDDEAADLASEFVADAEALLAECSGELVKTIGDAVMVRCENATEAVRLGVNLAQRVGERVGFPSVRVGMHTGSAIDRGGDWFGTAVNVAARVTGAASGGEVLLTSTTRDAAEAIEGITLRDRGRQSLRNLLEPVALYQAVTEGALEHALPIDPVCRMGVDPGRGAGELMHEGREYHFCSLACAAKFAARPDDYV
jgi:adenylate cyclase